MWIAWRPEPDPKNPDKPRKVSYSPRSKLKSKRASGPHSGWGVTRERARAFAERLGGHPDMPGTRAEIGIVLGPVPGCPGVGLGGIDLDQAIDRETRRIERWAQEIVDRFRSYTEISPSGFGLHILFFYLEKDVAALKSRQTEFKRPDGSGFEIYFRARYFTMDDDDG